ncbi:MAG: glycine cleavage system protein GcvH [Candidatus Margulisiibacteriota bacterium]
MVPENLRYSKEHEWVKTDGNIATIGITHFAQDQLGDVVYVELPKVGATLTAMQDFGVVESVKTVSTLYCPVSGKVTEVNSTLEGSPETINSEPYAAGWIIKVEMSHPAEVNGLLDAKQYADLIKK